MAKRPTYGQYNLLGGLSREPLKDFIIRKTHPEYDSYIHRWIDSTIFGLDIETFALGGGDAIDPFEGEIRLIQIAVQDKQGEFVLLWDLEKEDIENELQVLEFMLKESKFKVVGHNIKFDLSYLRVKYGFKATSVRDTMIFSQLLWAGVGLTKRGMFRHNLEEVAKRYDFEVSKDQQSSDWAVELTNEQLNYAANDALVTLKLYEPMRKDLEKEGLEHPAAAECLAIPAFVEMEVEGMPVCEKTLDEILRKYEAAREESILPFKKKFSMTNPASPKKVLHVLNGTFNPELEDTSAETLFAMSQEIPECEEIVKSLYLWRSLGTQVEYLKGIRNNIRGGRVRSDFRQIGPRGSGRSTSSKPNLQNPSNLKPSWKRLGLPAIREIFMAPPGRKLLIADLSSAHMRIAAQASTDPTLVSSYNRGKDIHSITAAGIAQWNGKNWTAEEIDEWRRDKSHPNHFEADELRRWAKNAGFGSLNFQAGWTLRDTFLKNEEYIEEETCTQMIESWRETYSTLYQYQWSIYKKVKKSNKKIFGGVFGETRGLTGRRLFVEKVEGKFKMTDAIAFTWLSTEADIIKKSMGILYNRALGNPQWGLKIINMCHDEIDIEVKEDQAQEAAKNVLEIMNNCMAEVITVIPAYDEFMKPKDLITERWSEK